MRTCGNLHFQDEDIQTFLPSPDLSSKEAREFLREIENCMDRPGIPCPCTVCLMLLSQLALLPDVSVGNIRILRTRYGALLSKCMAYLTEHRAGSWFFELERIGQSAIRTCPYNSTPLHLSVAAAYANVRSTTRLVLSLCTLVNSCFPEVCDRSVAAQRFRFKSHWPTSPEDLLPHGAGFKGLLHWLVLIDEMAVVTTLTFVYLWCRSAFYAEFDGEHSRELFRIAILSRFRLSLSQLVASSAGRRFGTRRASDYLGCVSTMLACIPLFGKDEWPSWSRLFENGCAEQLLSFSYTAIPLIAKDTEMVASQLRDLSCNLQSCVDTISIRSMAPSILHHFVQCTSMRGRSFGHFQHLLASLSSRRICSAPDCATRYQPQDDHEKRLRCGSCRILQYCSRECQRWHWRNKFQPHKEVCGTLRDLLERTSLQADIKAFEAACLALNIDLQRLAVIFTNLVGDRVVKTQDCELWSRVVKEAAHLLKILDLVAQLNAALYTNRADSILHQLEDMGDLDELQQAIFREMI